MKRFKRGIALLLALLIAVLAAACGRGEDPAPSVEASTEQVRAYKTPIAVPDGALSLGMAKLRTDRAYAYDVTTYDSADEIIAQLQAGTAELAILPPEAALQADQSVEGGVKMLAVTTLSLFYAVENGNTVGSVEDLKGKTVYAAAKGSPNDRLLRACLRVKDLDPEQDLTLVYVENDEALMDAALDGTASICLMTEPYASRVCVENEQLHIALDLNAQDKMLLAQGCLVARNAFIDAHADLLAEFLNDYEVSANFVSYNLQSAAVIYAANGYFSSADAALAALPRMHIVFLTGDTMRLIANGTYLILFGQEGEPADTFYYGL